MNIQLCDSRVVIERGGLARCGARLAEIDPHAQVMVITAGPIRRRHGAALLASLRRAGYSPRLIVLPDGERIKSLRWASHLYDRLIRAGVERTSFLLAFGGGVIGDLTGFVASTLLRGIRFVQLPTTLVAQVDAGIGGKTGVNHSKGKNLIGTFYQPKLVLIDVATLRTLPTRHVIGGLAEVVKYGVIADAELFDELERQASALLDCPVELMEQIVGRSARIKADVVRKDEREAGLRRILNYGHSLGHALETVTGYRRYHHGEAIAIGMQFASFLAVRRGMADHTLFERQGALLASLQLPTRLPARLPRQRLLAAMTHDKKVQQGTLQMVLPTKLGQVAVQPVASQELRDALAEFAAL